MASRIIFLPNFISEHELFQEKLVTFDWVPGIAISQAKKSIRNLHEAAGNQIGLTKILEISTRSEEILGISLSAFNLQFENKNFSVESAYQASKVFEKGGPYLDLLNFMFMVSPRLIPDLTLLFIAVSCSLVILVCLILLLLTKAKTHISIRGR
jgi:hypothetical protein